MRPVPLIAFAVLAACARVPEVGGAPDRAPSPPAAASPLADSVVRATRLPDGYFTVFDSITVDVDGDGVAERVELSADVGLDEHGHVDWDIDPPEWRVVVRDGAESYALFRSNQPAAAAFWIVREDSTRPPAILVQASTLYVGGGGTQLSRFVFDRSRGGYVLEGKVGARGPRAWYRGPREMEDLLPPTSWRGEPATAEPAARP
ncbi:hypothetical protein [Longimicrobium sp.]|uniref:hypothetical protein n=1 Tax=Longimicrobium sp. TaxID=2029185 RepID=UPI002BCCA9F3|nr:hypothetical protein [Longimicrobium sp.]HSU17812.1 hypothetical protein [Longimicrobium sp.]